MRGDPDPPLRRTRKSPRNLAAEPVRAEPVSPESARLLGLPAGMPVLRIEHVARTFDRFKRSGRRIRRGTAGRWALRDGAKTAAL